MQERSALVVSTSAALHHLPPTRQFYQAASTSLSSDRSGMT